MTSIAQCFPVVIPPGFVPSDSENDGLDHRYDGKRCPGQDASDGYRPRWGGGFRAGRIRNGKRLNHAAIDIMAAEGAWIVAPSAGVVALEWRPGPGRIDPGAGTSAKGGNYVVIDDNNGFRWYFAHLRDTPLVQPGDRVEPGALLGFNGRTGNAVRTVRRKDGSSYRYGCPHLHLSLRALTREALREAVRLGLDRIGMRLDPVPVLRPLYEADGWRG